MKKVIAVLGIALIVVGCGRKPVIGETKEVTLEFYGKNPPYTIEWWDTRQMNSMIIYQQTHKMTFKFDWEYFKNNRHYIESSKTGIIGDSVSITMYSEGKKAQKGYKSRNGERASAGLNYNALK